MLNSVSALKVLSGWTRYNSLPAENNNEERIINPSIRSVSANPNFLNFLLALKNSCLSRNLGETIPTSVRIKETLVRSELNIYRRYFQHAHFIPIVGVGKRGEY